jgi:predicted membrane protein
MPSDRDLPPDSPSASTRGISAILVAASLVAVFAYPQITGQAMALQEKMIAAIIGAGILAGVAHVLGIEPTQRHLKAFASPVVAWPVMAAGIAALITS